MIESEEFLSFTGGGDPGDSIKGEFEAMTGTLADSLLAQALLTVSNKNSEEMLLALKLICIRYGNRPAPAANETLGLFTGRLVITFPGFLDGILGNEAKTITRTASGTDDSAQRAYLADLEKTHREFSDLISRAAPQVNSVTPDTKGTTSTTDTGVLLPLSPNLLGDLRLGSTIANAISATAKSVLSKLKLDAAAISPLDLLHQLEAEMENAADLVQPDAENGILRIGNFLVETGKLKLALQSGSGSYTPLEPNSGCSFTAGIGDLLLVRQQLKGYRLGEFAHVENILRGEKRARNHRRLNRVTEDFFTSSEREETR